MARSSKTNTAGLTEKQEAFVRAFFETGNAAEAYRTAYDTEPNSRDSWIYVEACQLLDNPKVAQRLQELREQADRLSIFNREKALEEYEEARLMALTEKNPSAAVSAVTGKVKLFGLEPRQKSLIEHTGKDGGPIQTEEVSPRERIASRIAGLAAGTAKAGGTGEPE